jgi:hypothetical protein
VTSMLLTARQTNAPWLAELATTLPSLLAPLSTAAHRGGVCASSAADVLAVLAAALPAVDMCRQLRAHSDGAPPDLL